MVYLLFSVCSHADKRHINEWIEMEILTNGIAQYAVVSNGIACVPSLLKKENLLIFGVKFRVYAKNTCCGNICCLRWEFNKLICFQVLTYDVRVSNALVHWTILPCSWYYCNSKTACDRISSINRSMHVMGAHIVHLAFYAWLSSFRFNRSFYF